MPVPPGQGPPDYILFIFGICILAGIVRMYSRWFIVHHTVFMFTLGCLLGYMARIYGGATGKFFDIVNVDFIMDSANLKVQAVIMPVIIFEYIFAIDPRVFLSCSIGGILVVVLDYVLTIVTQGAFIFYLLTFYSIPAAYMTTIKIGGLYVMFAALTSVTDTSYVISTFYKMGSFWVLLKLMEIKRVVSLMSACILFTFMMYLDEHNYSITWGNVGLFVALQVVVAPLLGYFVAMITIWWLSRLYNDAAVEITVSLAMAYLLYYVGLFRLWDKPIVSAISVMVYSLYLNNRRDCFSLGHDIFLFKMIHIICYLIKTLMFSVMGFYVGFRDFNAIHTHRHVHSPTGSVFLVTCCIYTYCMLCRGVICMLLSPLLRRCGYKLLWQELATMVFCNVSGTVCIIFTTASAHYSLTDFFMRNPQLQYDVLFHMGLLAVLRSVIAGTCFKLVLNVLGMQHVSLSRFVAMSEALTHIQELTKTSAKSYKFDRFLADADWDTVYKFTNFDNPYKDISRYSVIGSAMKLDSDLLGDTRLHLLHAMKRSFWRQYEQGLLSLTALRILIEECNLSECKVHTEGFDLMDQLRKYYEISDKFNLSIWVKRKIERLQVARHVIIAELRQTVRKAHYWKRRLYGVLLSNDIIEVMLIIAILLSFAASVIVLVYEINCPASWSKTLVNVLYFQFNIAFVVLWTVYIVSKLAVFRWQYFLLFGSFFNVSLMIVGWIDIGLDSTLLDPTQVCAVFKANKFVHTPLIIWHQIFIAHRLLRILFLLEDKTNFIVHRVSRGLLLRLQLGYDVGKAYVYCKEDVSKSINVIIPNQTLQDDIRKQLNASRQSMMRQLATVQKQYPGIVISVKSQEACRRILNVVYESVNQMRKNGIVDSYEANMLEEMIKLRTKKLAKIPAQIELPSVYTLISKLEWVEEDKTLMKFLDFNAKLFNMAEGEIVDFDSDPVGGLYVLVSGLIRVNWYIGEPYSRLKQSQQSASSQSLTFHQQELNDYMTTGSTFGELALLMEEPVVINAVCETTVLMYHIQYESVRAALDWVTEPSLEYKLWQLAAARVSIPLLSALPPYRSSSLEELKVLTASGVLMVQHLQSEYEQKYATGEEKFNLSRYSKSNHVILIHGIANADDRQFVGPCVIPPDIDELAFSSIICDMYVIYLVPFKKTPNLNMMFTTSISELSTVPGLSQDIAPSHGPKTGLRMRGHRGSVAGGSYMSKRAEDRAAGSVQSYRSSITSDTQPTDEFLLDTESVVSERYVPPLKRHQVAPVDVKQTLESAVLDTEQTDLRRPGLRTTRPQSEAPESRPETRPTARERTIEPAKETKPDRILAEVRPTTEPKSEPKMSSKVPESHAAPDIPHKTATIAETYTIPTAPEITAKEPRATPAVPQTPSKDLPFLPASAISRVPAEEKTHPSAPATSRASAEEKVPPSAPAISRVSEEEKIPPKSAVTPWTDAWKTVQPEVKITVGAPPLGQEHKPGDKVPAGARVTTKPPAATPANIPSSSFDDSESYSTSSSSSRSSDEQTVSPKKP